MKKLDKHTILAVILGILMMSLFTSLFSFTSTGFGNVINKGEALYSASYIVSGLLLNLPIIFFILRLINKDEKIKLIAPFVDLGVAFIIFVFAIVLAAINYTGSAGSLVCVVAELVVKFFIVDFDDFKLFIKGAKKAAKEDSIETESTLETTNEEATNSAEPKEETK